VVEGRIHKIMAQVRAEQREIKLKEALALGAAVDVAETAAAGVGGGGGRLADSDSGEHSVWVDVRVGLWVCGWVGGWASQSVVVALYNGELLVRQSGMLDMHENTGKVTKAT